MNINPIVNTVYSVLNPNKISVLRHKNNKFLFDYFISYNDPGVEYFYTEDVVQNYYYDLFMTDDILLQNPIHKEVSDCQIKTIIAVHNEPPGTFKKEDLLIHHQATKSIPKIFLSQDLSDKWRCGSDSNSHVLEYGIPFLYNVENINIRKHPVVVMNLEDNPHIDNLYNSVQSQISGCVMIKNVKSGTRLFDIISILQQAKIVIDINSKINVLCALSCGCQVLTSVHNVSSPLLTHISNYANLIKILQDLLNINLEEKYRQSSAEIIANKYSYELFVKNIYKILNTYKHQPYIL